MTEFLFLAELLL